jgi:hypothetical protein
MSSDTDNFTYWNPRILATECVFQIVIMISCLCISVIEISFSDKIAAYYTILIAVDTFCDIVSDLYIEDDTNIKEEKEEELIRMRNKPIQKFKLIQNISVSLLALFLWFMTSRSWKAENFQDY